MLDLLLTSDGDLDVDATGDISTTESVIQAVSVRLRWFSEEWRLGPSLGFPYFDEVFVKNPNLTKIKYLLRDLVLDVDGVSGVSSVEISTDLKERTAKISIVFTVDEETYQEEVNING